MSRLTGRNAIAARVDIAHCELFFVQVNMREDAATTQMWGSEWFCEAGREAPANEFPLLDFPGDTPPEGLHP